MSPSRWHGLSRRPSGEEYERGLAAKAGSGMDMHGEATFLHGELARPSVVLDAGCGTGRVAIRLAELGHDVDGIDLDDSMIEVARRKAPQLRWQVADIAVAGETGRYDAVICAGNVIPLLAAGALDGTVANLRRVLRDGGVLVAGFGLDAAHLPAGCEPTALEDYLRACQAAGFTLDSAYSTWDRDAFDPAGGYVVTVHRATTDAGRPVGTTT